MAVDGSQAARPWEPFVSEPASSALLADFDGTLAEIVDDPSAARPLAGASQLLAHLANRLGLVAVISGRPVAFLASVLPPSVALSGLYGLETLRSGERHDHPEGELWRHAVAAAAAEATRSGPDGMRVEDKGLSLTLHYRGRPGLEADVRNWAEERSAQSGLLVRSARMSVELHPPIAADKGSAVHDIVSGFASVCYLGDDAGDLPAFSALDALAATGAATVRVAVRSAEAPVELLHRADIVVDGPRGAVELLARLYQSLRG